MTPSRVEFYILLSLLNGPRHGYRIMQDIEADTTGEVKLGPGTLYSVLKRFRLSGLVEECEADSDRRRCYRLTRKGRGVVTEEAQRVRALMRLVRQRGLLRHA
jgi:DNA-binding PadR family transcriptional regulator